MRRTAIAWLGLVVAFVGAVWWLLHPVCVPLSPAEVASFAEWQPIGQRTERQLHGPVFQERDGRWHQCKSWISRQLSF
jgi:4-amino-4-deoxy-L-arabinose transferase-like glycosyltransferase